MSTSTRRRPRRYPFGNPVSGRLPAEEMQGMLQRMEARQYDVPASVTLSEECASLLGRLLEPNPAARATMGKIRSVS